MGIGTARGIVPGFIVQDNAGPKTSDLAVEIVERKGLGHPDTLCDSIMERVAQRLARMYQERTGAVRHFNCDKALLVAGGARHRFGGGSITEPMRLFMGDRATQSFRGESLGVTELAVESAREWIRGHLRHVDPDAHLAYEVVMKPGSPELARGYAGKVVSNDTSAAVGYAPMTETERMVLEAERFTNSESFKTSFPETGEDVKVMGVRTGRTLQVTLAMPLLDRFLSDERDYFERKERVSEAVSAHLRSQLRTIDEVSLSFNGADRPGAGLEGIYASVIGISAESADSGEVGRGNRGNGLISFCRPAGSEAIAGKNPIGHVGKVHGMLAFALAEKLVDRIEAIEEVTVWLESRIGETLDRPERIFLSTHLAAGAAPADVEEAARSIVGAELEGLPAFCQELADGKRQVP
jgi:S-adenosylmethionine synthetase